MKKILIPQYMLVPLRAAIQKAIEVPEDEFEKAGWEALERQVSQKLTGATNMVVTCELVEFEWSQATTKKVAQALYNLNGNTDGKPSGSRVFTEALIKLLTED